jgi:disulfide bond formation protein DsbB
MFKPLSALAFPASQVGRALWIVFVALAILATVWSLELSGYRPCELCLSERYAFYAGAPLAALTAFAASCGGVGWARIGFIVLALAFLANAVLSGYHAGVEYHFWEGPTACTGSLSGPLNVADMLKQIQTVQEVRCDEPALRVLGVSLAGWGLIANAALSAYAALATRLSR